MALPARCVACVCVSVCAFLFFFFFLSLSLSLSLSSLLVKVVTRGAWLTSCGWNYGMHRHGNRPDVTIWACVFHFCLSYFSDWKTWIEISGNNNNNNNKKDKCFFIVFLFKLLERKSQSRCLIFFFFIFFFFSFFFFNFTTATNTFLFGWRKRLGCGVWRVNFQYSQPKRGVWGAMR